MHITKIRQNIIAADKSNVYWLGRYTCTYKVQYKIDQGSSAHKSWSGNAYIVYAANTYTTVYVCMNNQSRWPL